MTFSRSRTFVVSSVIVLTTLAAGASQASAQNLFDRLFGGGNRHNRVVREAPPPAEVSRPRQPAPVKRVAPKISGPSYNAYKTDALVRIDFSAIKPVRVAQASAAASIGIDAGTVGTTDREASAPKVEDAQTLVAQGPQQPSVASDAEFDTMVDNALSESAEAAGPASPAETASDGDRRPEGTTDSASAPGGAGTVPEAGEQKPAETLADALTLDKPGSEKAANPAGNAGPAPETTSVPVKTPPQMLTDAEIAGLQSFELFAEDEAAAAIVAHYSAVPDFIWVSDGKPNEHARQALRVLGDARSHGLDPQDYSVVVPADDADDESLARFEMTLSARMLRYVHDARSGRIDPNRISDYYDFSPKPLDNVATLQAARESGDVGVFLESQHPQNAYYKALRVELELLRASAENEVVVAPDTLVKPGETNPEFRKILSLISQKADAAFRAAHGDVLTRHLGSDVYAQELVPVIKAAQLANGLKDDGVIGPRTVRILAGESRAGRIEKVELALEQLRWLTGDFGERYVFLNTPSFTAQYFEGGKLKLDMRAIYGNNSTQTYFFQDEIDYVEFHPYWGVPKSILVNKYLPKLMNDPSYLDRSGFEVVNSKGQTVPSSSVAWGRYGANIPYDVRQRPGASNALGELKIMFPNEHAIYMHDTPEKHLFARENRAISNGCIRLQDPRAMAAAVLGWDRARLDARLDRPHSRENLPTKVPVFVTYFTAWPDASGKVAYHDDVYGRDGKLRAAIDKVDSLRSPSI